MSKLIDELVNTNENYSKTLIKGKWYIAKPIPFKGLITIKWRLRDCLRILKGKSFAVHYKQDELKK